MEGALKLEYVEREIQHGLKQKMSIRAFKDRNIARAFKIVTIILGSAVTVVLGVSESDSGKTVALILSGLITALSSIDALFNYQAKSINLINYHAKLNELLMQIEFFRSGRDDDDITVEEADDFFKQLIQIRSDFFRNRAETIRTSFLSTSEGQSK
ncbi:SLATT domain-containing protein [Paenibacillus illinoisensis]|uniref:SLATT domain-containing protein n=1 Tax=Paenibacillus illinoisensis TaxID=59845 RepID=UPI003A4D9BC6